MDVTALIPGRHSRSRRVRRPAEKAGGALSHKVRREAAGHPRKLAAGAAGMAGAFAAAVMLARRARNGDSPQVHTTPSEGHPAGTGTRSDRDIGGPTSPGNSGEDVSGGAPGTPPDAGFEPHS